MWRVLQPRRGMGFAAVWFVCRGLLAPRFLGLSPLTPFFFLVFVWFCVGWGFLRGVCLFFLWVFMVGAGTGW